VVKVANHSEVDHLQRPHSQQVTVMPRKVSLFYYNLQQSVAHEWWLTNH